MFSIYLQYIGTESVIKLQITIISNHFLSHFLFMRDVKIFYEDFPFNAKKDCWRISC